jgi:N-acetylglucosaminyldiphosphoundecaprenol N-acetyl-beta-D-mannosaminyltransferase
MKIFELEIWKHKYEEFFKEITDVLQPRLSSQERIERGVKWRAIFTPNPEICLKTLEDSEFRELLQWADYLTSDGIGLYIWYQINDFLQLHLSSQERIERGVLRNIILFLLIPYFIFNILFRKKYLYKKYGERICGSDLTNSLLEYSQENTIKIAIIDPSYPKDVEKCKSQRTFRDKISAKFPSLDFEFYVHSDENSDQIFENIKISNAIILFSTLWMKKQEISVMKGLELCPNLRLWLGIGSSFDYHTWFQKRAPKILRDIWFEWLYRIFTSPHKIQRLGRIYQALIVFPIKVIIDKK